MELSLTALARELGGELVGDGDRVIRGAGPFESVGPDQITHAADAKFLKRLDQTEAGAVLVSKPVKESPRNLVIVKNPYGAFARALTLFHPPTPRQPGISPHTAIGEGFSCGPEAAIGPFVSIGKDVTIGARATIRPNVTIGDGVRIGDDVFLHSQVVIGEHCVIGHRVTIHAGTVIGSDGFGFAPEGEIYLKLPHRGIVQIDDDVELGANNAIDRGTFGKTHIGAGVKTDNLVHVAHNVTVGENTLLVAQVGIAGSASIGRHSVLAGQVGVSGHLRIGDNVTVGPQAGVAHSIPDNAVVSGSPEIPHKLWLRVQRIIPRLPELKKKIESLEKKLGQISGE